MFRLFAVKFGPGQRTPHLRWLWRIFREELREKDGRIVRPSTLACRDMYNCEHLQYDIATLPQQSQHRCRVVYVLICLETHVLFTSHILYALAEVHTGDNSAFLFFFYRNKTRMKRYD